MANHLTGLGTTPLWKIFPNWRDTTNYGFDSSRKNLVFAGTANDFFTASEEKPQRYTCKLTATSKIEEKEYIEKFVMLYGRRTRFWMPLATTMLTLKYIHAAGATVLTFRDASFNFKGYERIYIHLLSGSLLTYDVASVISNASADTLEMTINTPTDRLIDPVDVNQASILVLCRLDQDALNVISVSTEVAEIELKIVELVKEYGDV